MPPNKNHVRQETDEKLLDLTAAKCETSKKHFDKNWTFQIFDVGASLGLIFIKYRTSVSSYVHQ